MKKIRHINITLFLLAASLLIFSGCNKPNLFSVWRNNEITIDGKYSDWEKSTAYYDEKTKVAINIANDNDYLYICLITRNRELETQIMEAGFVAWFDATGGEGKVFGIRFPTGLREIGISLSEEEKDQTKNWEDQIDKSELIDKDKERFRDKNFNKRLEKFEGLQEKIEIIETGSLKDKNNQSKPVPPPHPEKPMGDMPPKPGPAELSLEQAKGMGIEAKVGRENDYFVYELKVPLKKSDKHPFAIGVEPIAQIGLGLETSMGGMGMMPGGPPGGGRGGMPPGMGSRNKFQLWATVVLVSQASSQNNF